MGEGQTGPGDGVVAAPGAAEIALPLPASERGPLLVALALGALGVIVLVAALSGLLGSTEVRPVAPPAVPAAAPTPVAASGTHVSVLAPAPDRRGTMRGAVLVRTARRHSGTRTQTRWVSFTDFSGTHIPSHWMESFYPLYEEAQRTFGVSWLLIASVHKQETAFSTNPTTYHGLNFAGCCGGPMQFNVRNGPVTTWRLMRGSYRYNARPAAYAHRTRSHPSIYDDYDAIMAGAHLLAYNGAGYRLDSSAWWAAYDYYGHDVDGVAYADEVLARAISWSQHGFCINCAVPAAMIAAVHGAYGAPVLAALEVQAARERRAAAERRRRHGAARRRMLARLPARGQVARRSRAG